MSTLTKFIKGYAKKRPLRLHTPGHKGKLNKLDITELGEEFPNCYIEKAQNKIAKIYNTKAVRFLVCGSSMGIKAAILAANCDVLAFQGAHRSIREGCQLARVKYIEESSSPSIPAIKKALEKHKTIGAIYIESPDYFGRVVEEEVISYIKESGKLCFIDAAHGAHFVVSSTLFPSNHLTMSDIVNLSAHKTLNSLTQAAYLCINNTSLLEKVDNALRLLGTTSPSYLLLSSLETAFDNVEEKKYLRLKKSIDKLKEEIPCLKNDDFTRLVIDVKKLGTTSEKLYNKLTKRNIYAEMLTESYLVFIITTNEKEKDIKRLRNAILK